MGQMQPVLLISDQNNAAMTCIHASVVCFECTSPVDIFCPSCESLNLAPDQQSQELKAAVIASLSLCFRLLSVRLILLLTCTMYSAAGGKDVHIPGKQQAACDYICFLAAPL